MATGEPITREIGNTVEDDGKTRVFGRIGEVAVAGIPRKIFIAGDGERGETRHNEDKVR